MNIAKLGGGWDRIFLDIFKDNPTLRQDIDTHLNNIKSGKINVQPAIDNIFRCFRETPFKKVKCVLLGNEPYPYPNYADGICFSISNANVYSNVISGNAPHGTSLRVILNERIDDEVSTNKVTRSISPNGNEDLIRWTKRGVLLMNRSLTVETNPNGYSPNYKNPYTNMWKDLTEEIVRRLAKKKKRCVFIFLGSKWTDFVNTHKKEISEKGGILYWYTGIPPQTNIVLFRDCPQ